MERVDRLAERILNRLEQHKHDLVDKQQQLDSRMKELLEQRERLSIVAKRNIETVIPSTSATSKIERHGRTFYFCSENCKEAFIKGSN